MLSQLRPAIILFALFTVITGLAYPLAMTGVAQAILPNTANGSLVMKGGQVAGSRLIGQNFASDRYFWPRPSAAGQGYDAATSSGANLGAVTKKLLDRIAADAEHVRNADSASLLPADAVTASGSGLDPDISPQYAIQQVGRIARARNVSESALRSLVKSHSEQPLFGIFGEPRVNVLGLNMALDAGPPA